MSSDPNYAPISKSEKMEMLNALERLRATGVDYASVGGDQTKFRSKRDLDEEIARLKRELGIGKAKRRRVSRARMERM